MERMTLDRPEDGCESDLVGGLDALATKEQHQMFTKNPPHGIALRGVEGLGQVDAGDFGAERSR